MKKLIFLLAAFISLSVQGQKKISAMTSATTVNSSDYIPIVQGGANKKATAQQIATGGLGHFNIIDYGATPHTVDSTDDDTDNIQAALNAAYAAKGGRVVAPAGVYHIRGALQTSVNGTNPNSQLYIPLTRYGVDNGAHIELVGDPPNYLFNFSGGTSAGTGGTIFLSTIAGSGTTPAVFGTPTYAAPFGNFNHTYITFRNIIIRTTTHSGASHIAGTMSGINFENMSNFQFDQLSVEITSNFDSMAEPVNDTYGIIFPKQLNFAFTLGGTARVLGYRYGVVPGEHLNVHQFFIAFSHIGLRIGQDGQHGVNINCLSVESTKQNIALMANQSVYIASFHGEHHPSASNWYGFEYDVYVSNTAFTRGVYMGHANLGTWGSVGAVEYNFKTNSPNHTGYSFLNGRDIERDMVSLSSGDTWNCLHHKRAKVATGGTLTTSNPRTGEKLTLLVTGGTSATVNGTALSGSNIYTGVYDGSAWYWK